uniref:Uncharacterized protein n=1 Tax=Romanomermis culicivorax TaxID=13658 RepID=A0A915HN25_ROMCU
MTGGRRRLTVHQLQQLRIFGRQAIFSRRFVVLQRRRSDIKFAHVAMRFVVQIGAHILIGDDRVLIFRQFPGSTFVVALKSVKIKRPETPVRHSKNLETLQQELKDL